MPDWNTVYAEKNIERATPADVLLENENLLSSKGRALDFASGLAGNGIYLAKKSYDVVAWDLSPVAVEKINRYAKSNLLNLCAEEHDLENQLPEIKKPFDIVVVSYYLHRTSLRYLYDLLKPGGLLFYQTFCAEQYLGQGPARREFRLEKNELLSVFSDMKILFYQEDDEVLENKKNWPGQALFVAQK